MDEHPHAFTRFDVVHVVDGAGIDPEAVRRSIELSATKYCSVGSTLASGALEIHHSYLLRDAGRRRALRRGRGHRAQRTRRRAGRLTRSRRGRAAARGGARPTWPCTPELSAIRQASVQDSRGECPRLIRESPRGHSHPRRVPGQLSGSDCSPCTRARSPWPLAAEPRAPATRANPRRASVVRASHSRQEYKAVGRDRPSRTVVRARSRTADGRVRRRAGTLTTTPGMRRRSGRPAASSSVRPGPASEPSASKNSAYRSRLAGGVRVGLGDPDEAQLGVILEQVDERVPVGPQLEHLADGQAGPVAERLAVHHERVDLDPLDRHRAPTRPCRCAAMIGLRLRASPARRRCQLEDRDRLVQRRVRGDHLLGREHAAGARRGCPRTAASTSSSGTSRRR